MLQRAAPRCIRGNPDPSASCPRRPQARAPDPQATPKLRVLSAQLLDELLGVLAASERFSADGWSPPIERRSTEYTISVRLEGLNGAAQDNEARRASAGLANGGTHAPFRLPTLRLLRPAHPGRPRFTLRAAVPWDSEASHGTASLRSEHGEHPECADTEREEHDRHGRQRRPDTTTRVLPHQRSVAGDSHDEDEDGQEQDRVQRL